MPGEAMSNTRTTEFSWDCCCCCCCSCAERRDGGPLLPLPVPLSLSKAMVVIGEKLLLLASGLCGWRTESAKRICLGNEIQ